MYVSGQGPWYRQHPITDLLLRKKSILVRRVRPSTERRVAPSCYLLGAPTDPDVQISMHPARRGTGSLRDVWSSDVRPRKRIPLQDPVHHRPRQGLARAAREPLVPDPLYLATEPPERLRVRRYAEVLIVPFQLALQGGVLHFQLVVPMIPAPLVEIA